MKIYFDTNLFYYRYCPLKNIIKTRKLIFEQNVYAMDTLHAITAIDTDYKSFVTMDSDFKVNFGDIQILNPKVDNIKQIFDL